MNLPLNSDPYFLLTLLAPNTAPLFGSIGLLDGLGQGSAALILPAGLSPGLVGTTAHHAYLLFGAGFASNAEAVTLVP